MGRENPITSNSCVTDSPVTILGAEIADLLSSLTEKSLVIREEGSGRFRLMETIRSYGESMQLQDESSSKARSRHRDYYLFVAENAEANLRGAQQGYWFDTLETEQENLRAALDWSA